MEGRPISYKGNEIPTVVYPKGTLLFRATDNSEKDFVGPNMEPGKVCIPWDYNVFFYTDPFVVDGIDWHDEKKFVKAYVLTGDIRVVSMINPSKYHRGSRKDKNYAVTSCENTIEDTCMSKNESHVEANKLNPCLKKDFVKQNSTVSGWVAVAAADSQKVKDAIASGKVSGKIGMVKDSRGTVGPPEVVLYPLRVRKAEDIIESHPEKFIAEKENLYNYKVVATLKRHCMKGEKGDRSKFLSENATYDAENKIYIMREKARRTKKIHYDYTGVWEIAKKCSANQTFVDNKPTIEGGLTELSPNIDGPWRMNSINSVNTFNYLVEHLGFTFYILCVTDGRATMYRVQTTKTAPQFKEALIKPGAITMKNPYKNTKEWRVIQCLVSPFKKEVEVSPEYETFFDEMPHALPEGMYVLNITDAVLLRKDGKEPWPMASGDKKLPFKMESINDKFIPILSSSGGVDYWDIPIPTFDDLDIAFGRNKEIGTEDMANWKLKKPVAVFRGSASGCGVTPETNQRIKLASMKKTPFLDVGLTGVVSDKLKFDPVYGLTNLDLSKKLKPVQRLSFRQQSFYKYIIHIDGNVAAYRLLKMMTLGSVILKVQGEYILWFEHMLKDGVNMISIKKDLSDLEEKIEWCKAHDNECKEIARKGRELALKCLDKKFLFDTFAKTLWAVAEKASDNKEPPTVLPAPATPNFAPDGPDFETTHANPGTPFWDGQEEAYDRMGIDSETRNYKGRTPDWDGQEEAYKNLDIDPVTRKQREERVIDGRKISEYFPMKEGVLYNKMKLTDEGVYSVTRRDEGEAFENLIKKYIPGSKDKLIVDTTANVGSDTLRFSQLFKKVDAIELNAENYEALVNNIEVFKATNVKTFKDDATKIYDQDDWGIDVLYCDPPWGGKEYMKKKNIDLKMGDKRIDKWINDILKKNARPEHIILKLPKNYNFSRLDELPNVKKITRETIRNVVFIFIEVEREE